MILSLLERYERAEYVKHKIPQKHKAMLGEKRG